MSPPSGLPGLARRIRADEARALRALRLEALEQAPAAYLETLASARALDDAAWTRRATEAASSPDFALFVVEAEDRRLVGLAGLRRGQVGGLVVAVYVVPAARGRGVLDALLAELEGSARAWGLPRLTLWVHRENHAARRAYGRLGFAETGAAAPYPREPGGEELELVRRLAPAPEVE